jgi:hypothetical protein
MDHSIRDHTKIKECKLDLYIILRNTVMLANLEAA